MHSTFFTRAPVVGHEVVVDGAVEYIGDVSDRRQHPDFVNNTLGRLVETVTVGGRCSADVVDAAQLQRQVDDMRLGDKADEVLDVIETVHHVVCHRTMPEVVL